MSLDLEKLMRGLQYLHGKGFAHRDIKLENILVDVNYNLKICDFGLACPIEGSTGDGFSNRAVGTISYMAPELILGSKYQGIVADMFALGVVFFMMYAGQAPFQKADFDDPLFYLIALNKHETFFKYHG